MNAKKVIQRVKMVIPAGLASPVPPIGPVLGQNHIPLSSFCSEFNEKVTGHIVKELDLSVKINKFSKTNYEIQIGFIPLSLILSWLSKEEAHYSITVEQLYDIVLLYSEYYNVKQKRVLEMSQMKIYAKSLFGTINSINKITIK